MTLAANVTGEPQHLMPPASGTATGPSCVANAAPGALKCPYMAGPCPSLARLFAATSAPDDEETRAWVGRLAPCASCRVNYEGGRSALRGVRLGQREREVLIGALEEEKYVVTTPGMTRSLSAARRRAAQGLMKAGLVHSTAGASHARATVSLTPLGRYIMAAYGRFIQAGKPVRWDRPASKVPLPGRDPEALFEETFALTQSAMRETLEELKRVLIAAVGRPVKDPAKLERVTRHLQSKAEGLQKLLEARPQAPFPALGLASSPVSLVQRI